MKFINNGNTYTVYFFFGDSCVPKQEMDETTPYVRAMSGESFNVEECEWLEETPYEGIYKALCRMPAVQDKTPSEVALIARELADSGHYAAGGRILDGAGEEVYPI